MQVGSKVLRWKATAWLMASVLMLAACGGPAGGGSKSGGTSGSATPAPAPAPAPKESVSLAYYQDPGYELTLWAAKEGKVTSDKVTLKAEALGIVQLIQMLNTKQYDLGETAAIAVPRLIAAGAPIKIVGGGGVAQGAMDVFALVAREASGIKNPSQLKGKKLATEALGATNFLQVRMVLNQKYGLNAALKGGDVELIEAPPTNIGAMLQQGQVDAAYLNYATLLKLRDSKDLRVISNPQKEYQDAFKATPVVSVLVTFDEKIKAKGPSIQEALKLLRASHDYYRANRAEVEKAVAEKYKADLAFLTWWGDNYDFRIHWDSETETGVRRLYDLAAESKEVPKVPNFDALIWKGQ